MVADVSVVIVNYNVRHFLEQCLESVYQAQGNLTVEVFVIDNASVDGSQEYISKRFPAATYIYNDRNVGFSKANNQGIRLATGRYVLLLNPDTLVESDTLSKCMAYMDVHPEAGGLGVKMVDGAGVFLPESKRGLPTPWVAFYKIFGFSVLFPNNRKFGRYHLSYLPQDEINEVDILSGAFMWLRSETLTKVGLLDEDYFMYGEDIDLSYRIQKGGYKNVYFPKTRIIHYKGESTKRTSVNYVFVFYRAMIIFAQKHFAKRNGFFFNVLIESAVYIRAFYAIVNRLAANIALPILDFIAIWGSMYGLKELYEVYVKQDANFYPPSYTLVVVPIYGLVWVLTGYLNGIYKKPFSLSGITFSMAAGALIISAASNFFDDYRYSKALILLGMGSGGVLFVANRIAANYLSIGRITLAGQIKIRTLVVGTKADVQRAMLLVTKSEIKSEIVGWVSPPEVEIEVDNSFIGRFENLKQIVSLFKVDEVIFCSKSMAANTIIEAMTLLSPSGIQFKISAQNSEYIIGSNGPQSVGELYSFDIKHGLAKNGGMFKKQLFDYVLSLLLLILSPIVVWFVQNKRGYFDNILEVLMGQRTWVGYADSDSIQNNLLKPGVLKTTTGSHDVWHNPQTIDQNYTTHYSPSKDIYIIFKSYSQLGNRAAQ